MKLHILILSMGLLSVVGISSALGFEVRSPDGNVVLTFQIKNVGADSGCPVYHVDFKGRNVIAESRLGLDIEGASLNAGLTVSKEVVSQGDTTWNPVCAERNRIRDHYNQTVVDLKEQRSPYRIVRMTFRAYNEGVAICYTLPAQDGLKDFTIRVENTRFSFGADYTTWAVYAAQGNYDPASLPPNKKAPLGSGEVPLSKVGPGVERPLTVRLADDLYASITEAGLVDYARMKLRPAKDQPYTMEVFLDGERGRYGNVSGTTPFSTPWRVIMLADSPAKLMEQNYLILNLNAPCAIQDVSWIKPGKAIRELSFTTAGGKACVDFCVERGLEFVEYDAGWYGHEYDPKADARDVHLDPLRQPDPNALNLHEVIAYADSKGIGIILYVNQLALEKQLDEILPLYKKWGVAGVKFGFVNVGSQYWTRWLHEAIKKAAQYKLMVDIHDEFRSTGFQRTYPNLMTVEGVLGNEGFPSPIHKATLPFTRFLTGPADFTFCWSDKRLKQTHAHQLAISTIFFSPWQFLFWYDSPASIKVEAALEYWKHLPTTWDETKVLKAEIGKCVSVARRRGEEWYVGTIHPEGREQIELPLSFLTQGKRYSAFIYSDENPNDPQSKAVKVVTLTVDSATLIKADIFADGGHAMRIIPSGVNILASPALKN